MDTDIILEILILIILLLLSAFFSSAETAFTTVSSIRMRTLAEDGDRRAAKVLKIKEQSPKMLSAILIGNNVVNLSASALTTTIVIHLSGGIATAIATGLLTVLILIFGEISPKTIAMVRAEKLAKAYAPFLYVIMIVLTPVIIAINFLAGLILRLFGIKKGTTVEPITEDELRTIVDVSQENGIIENEERDIIQKLFDFTDAKVQEVMVPRNHMTYTDVTVGYDELIELFRESHFSRIPVCEENTDDVVGIIYLKDLVFFEDKGHFSARDVMREPFYTYENKNTADLLAEMREASISIAIVLDEYGATAGMISLEDLLEEIVGDIHDEYDENEEADISVEGEREYLIRGAANLEDVCEELSLPFKSEDSDSVGGYLLELLGHVPAEGEQVTTETGYTLSVDKMEGRSISAVRLLIPEKEEETEEAEDKEEQKEEQKQSEKNGVESKN